MAVGECISRIRVRRGSPMKLFTFSIRRNAMHTMRDDVSASVAKIFIIASLLAVGCDSNECPGSCAGPASDAACKIDASCSLAGQCFFKAPDCAAAAPTCGRCEPRQDVDCKNADVCRLFGDCTVFELAGRRECAPGSDGDCVQSKVCKDSGDCKRTTHPDRAPTCSK